MSSTSVQAIRVALIYKKNVHPVAHQFLGLFHVLCCTFLWALVDLILECMAWNKTTSKFFHGLYVKLCSIADAISDGLLLVVHVLFLS